jgi:sugar lactone lactonase YvrE
MDGTRPGSLALFDAQTEAVEVAFAGSGASSGGGADGVWGDAACPGPPEASFSPHGIDLAALGDQGLRLLVVNHGSREAVEFFEVREESGATVLRWRGCAPAPANAFLNDVVNSPNGGFLVTHMMPRDAGNWGILKATLGFDTGHVYAWLPGSGYEIVAGTEAPFPNGIELSADGQHLYLNSYSQGEVRKIDRATGELLGTADVPSPDNVTWGSDGRLLVASHQGGLSDQLACMDLERGACGMEFAVVAVDPDDMETETILRTAGPPMGAGTVALDLGDGELLIGSFAADRMLRTRARR